MTQEYWKFLYGSWRKAVKRGEYPPVERRDSRHWRTWMALTIALNHRCK